MYLYNFHEKYNSGPIVLRVSSFSNFWYIAHPAFDRYCNFYPFIRNAHIINEIFGNGMSKRDIIQCIGIKRTNACDLSSIDIEGGVAIYPTYSLINSNCYCNTRYFLCNPDILNNTKFTYVTFNYLPHS